MEYFFDIAKYVLDIVLIWKIFIEYYFNIEIDLWNPFSILQNMY